jgi:uncharacterized protein (DUF1684 family)
VPVKAIGLLCLVIHMATPPIDGKHELAAWRAVKDREMRGDDSPLAYVGPRQLEAGHNTLGSGAGDKLRFQSPGLPERALDLVVQDVRIHLVPLLPLVSLNGQPAAEADLKPGDQVEVGPINLRVLGRGLVLISDLGRPESLSYKGLHYLPDDPRYRVEGTVDPAPPGKILTLQTSQHQERQLPLKGVIHFRLQGQDLTLEGFQLGDRPNDLFVVFKDATNGDTTYGAGRFLWVKGPVDGKTIVDFNQAWNPLCAYSDGYNCPLAPPENRLKIAIPVGEAPYGHR